MSILPDAYPSILGKRKRQHNVVPYVPDVYQGMSELRRQTGERQHFEYQVLELLVAIGCDQSYISAVSNYDFRWIIAYSRVRVRKYIWVSVD